ncbi:MAG: ORF6N domain-containing protein [Bacteroidales bacterium]|nr:ORF6N domain-containing protein [Bacteroidales bacterium]
MTTILEVENRIITLRDQQVILDSDVADLYGVETKRINEAVSNNPDKFPKGYILELSDNEKIELVENFDRFNRQKHSTSLPKAFTEKGLYMLATILKSPKAVQTTIAIVEAYAKLKELSRVMAEIPQKTDSVEQKTLLQRGGQLIDDLMTDVLPVQSSETSFELNLAMLKFKHSVKRGTDEEIEKLREENAELKRKLEDNKI